MRDVVWAEQDSKEAGEIGGPDGNVHVLIFTWLFQCLTWLQFSHSRQYLSGLAALLKSWMDGEISVARGGQEGSTSNSVTERRELRLPRSGFTCKYGPPAATLIGSY